MLPDCIDPQAGGLLRKMMKQSDPVEFSYIDEVWAARQHWSSCPACRGEFISVSAVFAEIGLGLENCVRGVLSDQTDDILKKKRLLSEAMNELRGSHPETIPLQGGGALLAASNELPRSYAELIVELVKIWSDVFHMLMEGQEVLNLRVPPVSTSWGNGEPTLSNCREFMCSLDPDVQHFVASSALANDLLDPLYSRMYRQSQPYHGMPRDEEIDRRFQAAIAKSELSPDVSYRQAHEEIDRRFQAAIASSELRPDVFFRTIELAALGYTHSHFANSNKAHATTVVQAGPPHSELAPREATALPNVLRELKQDFDNALDSLKAGQMETNRLIEHNQRPAAAYEPDIEARLGAFLYSRLGETTRRGLQVAEYLYHINSQEPNYFLGPVMQMALAYENELAVRVIWPFVNELQNAGQDAYDGQGVSREPLLSGGKVPGNCMMLGNLARYLRLDAFMRSKLSALGFDVDAITKDSISIAFVRNRAAHAPVCERAVADDLRHRMLCRDGVFSRLHPTVGGNPAD